jgi:hypothetical protein
VVTLTTSGQPFWNWILSPLSGDIIVTFDSTEVEVHLPPNTPSMFGVNSPKELLLQFPQVPHLVHTLLQCLMVLTLT